MRSKYSCFPQVVICYRFFRETFKKCGKSIKNLKVAHLQWWFQRISRSTNWSFHFWRTSRFYRISRSSDWSFRFRRHIRYYFIFWLRATWFFQPEIDGLFSWLEASSLKKIPSSNILIRLSFSLPKQCALYFYV